MHIRYHSKRGKKEKGPMQKSPQLGLCQEYNTAQLQMKIIWGEMEQDVIFVRGKQRFTVLFHIWFDLFCLK